MEENDSDYEELDKSTKPKLSQKLIDSARTLKRQLLPGMK